MSFLGDVGGSFESAYGNLDDQFKSAYTGSGSQAPRPPENMGARQQVSASDFAQLQSFLAGGSPAEAPSGPGMSLLEAILNEHRRRRRFDTLFSAIRQRAHLLNRGGP